MKAPIETRLRIDNAHFIKKYCDLFKSKPRSIKAFYVALIGKLIMCKHEYEAEEILSTLFI